VFVHDEKTALGGWHRSHGLGRAIGWSLGSVLGEIVGHLSIVPRRPKTGQIWTLPARPL